MEIEQSGSQPSGKGRVDWFSGTVRIDPLFAAHAPTQEALDGKAVDWMEHVSDEQYRATPHPTGGAAATTMEPFATRGRSGGAVGTT